MTYETEKRKAGRNPLTIVELDLDKCANRYSESRVNLITQPEDFSHADWAKTNLTVTANTDTAPDGTATADALTPTTDNISHLADDTFSKADGVYYAASVYAKPNGYNSVSVGMGATRAFAAFNLSTGTVTIVSTNGTDFTDGAATIIKEGDYYRCSIIALSASTVGGYMRVAVNATAAHNGQAEVYVGDGASGVIAWGAQLTEGNILYDYGVATCNGSQGNLLTRSEEFDHADWVKENTYVATADAGIAPDGTLTADRGVYPTGTLARTYETTSGLANKTVTFLVWLKSNTGSDQSSIKMFLRETGFGTTYGSLTFTVTTEWQRFSFAALIGGASVSVLNLIYHDSSGDPEWDLLQWGAQLTEIDFIPVYQKTVATAIASTGRIACFNTFKTCQDTANYINKVPKTYRFCDGIPPVGINAFPCINKIVTAPTKITPGKGLGHRANVSIDLVDFPHDDRGIDQYLETRNYDTSIGTFFGKLYARNPFYQSRSLRVKSGYVGDTFDEANDFITKHYVIEKFDRNSANGMVKIIAKDPLKLADNDRSQCPVVTSGALTAGITNSSSSLALTAGTGSEYGASGHVRINDEIIKFGSRTDDTLNSLSRGQYGSAAKAHDTDDGVQLCKEFLNVNITDICYDLLVNFANIRASFIKMAEWNVEKSKWFTLTNLTTLISEPTGILELLHELTEENLIDIWWDEKNQTIRLNSIIPDVLNTEQSNYNDDNHLIADSIQVIENIKDRVSQVWIYFAMRNYTQSLTSVENFAQLKIQVDATSESDDAYGDKRVRKMYSRWFNAGSSAIVSQSASRLLLSKKDNQLEIKFDMDAKDANLWTGDFFFLNTKFNQEVDGTGKTQWMQVLSVVEKELGSIFSYNARAAQFTGRFWFIAPNGTPDYESATDEDKAKYAFIAPDAAGFPSDSGEAYKII